MMLRLMRSLTIQSSQDPSRLQQRVGPEPAGVSTAIKLVRRVGVGYRDGLFEGCQQRLTEPESVAVPQIDLESVRP